MIITPIIPPKSPRTGLALMALSFLSMAGAVAYVASAVSASRAATVAPLTYELVLDYAGQRFVIDHALTFDDCLEGIASTKSATSCEAEGR